MMWFIVIALVIGFALLSHYGLPEKINPDDYQELPPNTKLMQGADPYILEGESDTAFLLVHGFEGSPYTLRGIGEILHRQGHTVIAPLLPGHGTSVVEFSKTRYEHWYSTVQKIYLQYRQKYSKFFIVGFSMGGNLSLRLAIHYSHRLPPTGLVCISSPVIINGFANGKFILQDWRLLFSGIAKLLTRFVPKKNEVLASAMISPWVGYSEAYSLGPLHSLKLNVSKIRPHLKYIHCPICLIQAANDGTISPENLHFIYRKVSSREKRAFQFTIDENVSTRHVLITHDHIRERVYHYILEFIKDTLSNFDFPRNTNPDPGFWKKVLMKGKKKMTLAKHFMVSLLIISMGACARFKVSNLDANVLFSIPINKNSLSFPSQTGILHGIPRKVGITSERLTISEPENKSIKIFKENQLERIIISKDRENDTFSNEPNDKKIRSFSEYLKIPGNIVSGTEDDFYVLNYYPNLSGPNEQSGFYKIIHYDLKGQFIQIIGRNGQSELPYENVIWMDTDTSGRLWVAYRHLDDLYLEGYEENQVYRSYSDQECVKNVFMGQNLSSTDIARCEFMYPFPSGEKLLLVGRVDSIKDSEAGAKGRVFKYRTFVVIDKNGKSEVIFGKINDPEDFPYIPYNENEILLWQTLDYNRVKLPIYSLHGALINNLQITQTDRFENWRSTWFNLQGKAYSIKVDSLKLEVIRWK